MGKNVQVNTGLNQQYVGGWVYCCFYTSSPMQLFVRVSMRVCANVSSGRVH